MFALQKCRITAVKNFIFLKHLTYDHFNVLIVDLYALQAIHVLNFVNHVVCQGLNTHNRKDVMRCRVAIHDVVAFLDEIALSNWDVLAFWHHVFDWFTCLI